MTQQRDGFCLALQSLAELRMRGEPGTQDFDRDRSFESQIACFVHLAHPALADMGNYFVSAKTGPDGQTRDREERSELEELGAKNGFGFGMRQQFKNLVSQRII